MTQNLRPNWGKWKHFHIVKLWQGVALSMNLDPKHIGRSPQGWLAGEDTILAKSLEFKERLDLAISNILKLTVEHMVSGRPAQWEVTLASFAAQAGRWWKSEVPPEMAALAKPDKAVMIEAVNESEPKATKNVLSRTWPWGSRETKLLSHLAAAAEEFWSRYDPADTSTAPNNDQVIDWLMKRTVPKRTAEIMTKILRADEVPAGNRKRNIRAHKR